MKSISLVPIPPRLAKRPRDARGYPIPYGVLQLPDGSPDFRTVDMPKWAYSVQYRRCGLCGEPLGTKLAFIGGPVSKESRCYVDLPMHRECAEYALQVCPYLALPKATYRKTIPKIEGVDIQEMPDVLETKPERFWLGITKDFTVVQLPQGDYGMLAAEWIDGEWWKDGKRESDHGKETI